MNFQSAIAGKSDLNLYMWGNHVPAEIVRRFSKETGIRVNLTEYDSNETMFTKIKTFKNTGYDVIAPSSYYVERMAKLGILLKLDKKKLPNIRHLSPELLNLPFDPSNIYSVPQLWGTTGIIINTKYIPKNQVRFWKDLWDPRYKNQLMMLNDMREVLGMSLLALGYSINETNLKHIEEAYLRLNKLLSNIKLFSLDTVPNIYVDEDARIGMAWSGDAKAAHEENASIEYIYPEDGFAIWIDNLSIVKDAPHVENAYKFINFLLRPDIAQTVVIHLGYSTANATAIKLTKGKNADNSIRKIMKKGQIQLDLDENTRCIYEKYWEKLKIDN